ncbi:MAG: hypothetical protein GXY68_03510 [Chloroflexi bacterium]|nr:hypothetical protein [Chloroflexota bacterium]
MAPIQADEPMVSNAARLLIYRRGAWVISPADAGVFAGPDDGAAGQLCYLLQSADARPLVADLCQRVTKAFREAYAADDGAPAVALRAGLLAANEALFDHNVRADADARLLMGMACVLVQGQTIYMGRLGPACAWVLEGDELVQFPEHSLWHELGEALLDISQEPPLGLRIDIEPELAQQRVAPGARVVLITQDLRRRLQPTALRRLLDEDDEALRAELLAAAQGRDLGMVVAPVVQLSAPMTAAAVANTSIAPEDAAPRELEDEAFDDDEAFEAETLTGEGLPVDQASEADIDESPLEEPAETIAEEAPLPRPPVTPRPATPLSDAWNLPPTDETTDDEWDDEGRSSDAEPTFEPAAELPHDHIDLNARAEQATRTAGRALRRGVRRARNDAEDVLLKVLPDRLPERPERRTEAAPSISPASQSLVVVALLLPLLVLFTVIMVRVQYNRELDGRRGSIHQTALSEYDQAINASSPELRADGLYRTLELTEAGLAILPGDTLLVDLRMRTTLKLDEVEKVERLFHFKRLDSFTTGGTVVNQPSRIVISDKSAFVLNKGAGQVHGYTLSDVGDAVSSRAEIQVPLREGQTIGATPVGELIDMAYLAPTGSRTAGDLVVLDRTGTLWAWRNETFQPIPVGDSDRWVKPVAIGAYMGNLYVLDPMGERILKYLPTNNAYTTPPFPYLSSTVTVDMLGAVDMAIDGNVYVLFADGTIHKFFEGEEVAFPMTGLPSPMRNPSSIFVSGPQEPEAEGYLYVTDWGNQRIVQFDKAGNYLRSFKANTSEPYMEALGSVFVDETTARMFIFSERQFVLVSLPPLGN